jgi:hypothetical protein
MLWKEKADGSDEKPSRSIIEYLIMEKGIILLNTEKLEDNIMNNCRE